MKKDIEDQNNLKVYDIGAEISLGGLNGLIKKIIIGPNRAVKYLVVWWNENHRYLAWIDAIELDDKRKNLHIRLESLMAPNEYIDEPFGFARGCRASTKKQLH